MCVGGKGGFASAPVALWTVFIVGTHSLACKEGELVSSAFSFLSCELTKESSSLLLLATHRGLLCHGVYCSYFSHECGVGGGVGQVREPWLPIEIQAQDDFAAVGPSNAPWGRWSEAHCFLNSWALAYALYTIHSFIRLSSCPALSYSVPTLDNMDFPYTKTDPRARCQESGASASVVSRS